MQKTSLTLTIDCSAHSTLKSVHETVAAQLHFPPYYGANLDALRDCLGDVLLEHTVTLVWHDTPASRKNTHMQALHRTLGTLLKK
jgi:RNAse (barnase) inhibitor barstar